jgi:hypothetical protein
LLLGLIDPPNASLVEGGKVPKPVPSADAHIKEGAGDAPSPASEGVDAESDEGGDEGGDAAAGAASTKKKKSTKKGKKADKEEPMMLFGAVIPGMRGATLYKWMDAISGTLM